MTIRGQTIQDLIQSSQGIDFDDARSREIAVEVANLLDAVDGFSELMHFDLRTVAVSRLYRQLQSGVGMTGAVPGDLLDASLIETSKRIRSREVSAQELAAASIARAEALQPEINAFIRIDAEAAMQAAEQADREIAAGRYRGVLHGIPLAHKDMFYRAGEITSCGSDIRRDFRAEFTSNLIARLDEAGAVSVGWLNLSEFAGGPDGP